MNLRVAGQRQPGRRRDPLPAQPFRTIALGGEDDVETARLFTAAIEADVGIDGPEGRGP